MQLNFPADTPAEKVFSAVSEYLSIAGFDVLEIVNDKPWGGYFVLDENKIEPFSIAFFATYEGQIDLEGKLSPKILVVAPGKRLSWQYHHRRAELWRQVSGVSAVDTGEDDDVSDSRELEPGDIIALKQGERHRLIGLESWGVVAEIWQHTDPAHPSDEEDIIRVEDDFGR